MLVIGLRGLGAEVAKNLVLAGVRELTVLDQHSLSSNDVAGRFLTQTEGENVSLNIIPTSLEYRHCVDDIKHFREHSSPFQIYSY